MNTNVTEQTVSKEDNKKSAFPYIIVIALSLVALVVCLIVYRDKIKQAFSTISKVFKRGRLSITSKSQECD